MTTPIPPDTVAPGQTGHIDAHNAISDVLTQFQDQLTAIPSVRAGTATLVAGAVSVTLTTVGDSTVILLSRLAPGGTLGHLSVPSVTAAAGFTVSSTSASETSVISWLALG
jgi:selenophosphate synthase